MVPTGLPAPALAKARDAERQWSVVERSAGQQNPQRALVGADSGKRLEGKPPHPGHRSLSLAGPAPS